MPPTPMNALPKAWLKFSTHVVIMVGVALGSWTGCSTSSSHTHVSPSGETKAALREAITFHASFDRGLNADHARGDSVCYQAPSMKQPRVGVPGLPLHGKVKRVEGGGRYGAGLKWEEKVEDMVYFNAENNVAYGSKPWSGSVSVWLKLDPEKDLAPTFADPLQITPRSWNDASFFLDFSKDEKPRHFRLGTFADREVWDPNKVNFDTLPIAERPMVTLTHPPFSGEEWTHVVFTWEQFNTGLSNGVARLYMNGVLAGEVRGRTQTFTWIPKDTRIMLGLSYTGWLDELSVFNRALKPEEVAALHGLNAPVTTLLR